MIDLNNDMTVVWNTDCVQMVQDSGNCSQSPTYLNAQYSTTETIDRTFTNDTFGGYLASGNVYVTKMNQNLDTTTTSTRLLQTFSASTIYEDTWLLN